jgi:hypothetical protein
MILFKLLRIPILLTSLAIIGTWIIFGPVAALTVGILGILEISLSVDNAVLNAKVLTRMDEGWQRVFLTVGILIAVFGMRLLFPLLVVGTAAHISPWEAIELAIKDPSAYAHHLHQAHPSIAAFGGVFLAMLFFDWLFEDREYQWLRPLEDFLARIGRYQNMAVIIVSAVLVLVAIALGHTQQVLIAGLLGMVTYLLVSGLDNFLNTDATSTIAEAGLGTFLYLEVLDASLSFDGVVSSFAITSNIFIIALGLGVGAMYVRGLTVYLVRKGTLSNYVYLEHGAHWAIGILAGLLFATIKYDIPDVVTGLLGVGFIVAAFISSLAYKKKAPALE